MASAIRVIQAILDQQDDVRRPAGAAVSLKLVATTVSLGCGASGGIFSPSLYLGATLGAAFASAMGTFFRTPACGLPSAAIVGMAAIVGALPAA